MPLITAPGTMQHKKPKRERENAQQRDKMKVHLLHLIFRKRAAAAAEERDRDAVQKDQYHEMQRPMMTTAEVRWCISIHSFGLCGLWN